MLQLLTSKPVLYVCNVDEESAATGNKYSKLVEERAKAEGTEAVIISAAIESEVAQLDNEEEKKEFLESLGLTETGLAKLFEPDTISWDCKLILPAVPKRFELGHLLKVQKRRNVPVLFTLILKEVLSAPKPLPLTTL